MSIPDYEYPVDQCDVPTVRCASLSEYRTFRHKCLDYIRGPADTSVMNQVHDLAWQTAVYRTLNEARRIESDRVVNGAMWELITAGYASLMTVGIRRLVDKDRRTTSVWNVIEEIKRRPELLTRETFVCYDGLPYDYEMTYGRYVKTLDMSGGPNVRWIPTKGPEAWGTSKIMHEAFDRLSGNPRKRKRSDTIDPSIVARLQERLGHPTIEKVCTMVDRRIAHAEHIPEDAEPVPIATYNDIDEALRIIVRASGFLSASFFQDATFGSVVPTPQFNVLEGLDHPWTTPENLPALHEHWNNLCDSMDAWDNDIESDFLSPATEGYGPSFRN